MLGRAVLLLEDMRKQNAATIEAVFSTRNELKREIQEQGERFERRFDLLEGVVRDNSREIIALGKRMDSLEGAVQQNSEGICALAAKIDGKADRQVVEAMEHRIDGLERAARG